MSEMVWFWQEGKLYDASGNPLATTSTGTSLETALETTEHLGQAAHQRILLERAPGSRFSLRATTATGETFRCRQTGLSITRLRAVCGDREYLLDRINPFRRARDIHDFDGRALARTEPQQRNRLDISPIDGELPALDAVFITYACFQVDIPQKLMLS